jgi:NADPH-dependent curcumin reductase CurA
MAGVQMAKNTQVLFRCESEGLPSVDDFEIVEKPLPEIGDDQFLIRGLYLSLDPYMRMLMGGGWTYSGNSLSPGDLMVGRILGEVVESRNSGFRPGEHVVGRLGWQTHAVSDGSDLDFKLTARDGIPLTAYLGACGSNGVTAWVGLKVVAGVTTNDTVLVSTAAGSVGSTAGQIAKSMGCTVIGIAGGAEKCRVVTNEFAFDACCDYKAPDLSGQLSEAAPGGYDVYFDNVGGEMLDMVMEHLNRGARVAVCGVLSQYNDGGTPYGVTNMRLIFDRSLRLEGFVHSAHRDTWPAARAELEESVLSGRLTYRETVAEGIVEAPAAFIGMLQGENVGKQLVRLA